MAKSLNSVQLIGNLTRDPELRTTQSGKSVCTVGLATGRQWKTESGEKKEETEFHRIVAWGKLGEICSQYLKKGQKAYFQGRLSTRKWTAQDGTEKETTEIIAEDMLLLPNTRSTSEEPPLTYNDSPVTKEVPARGEHTDTKSTVITKSADKESGMDPDDIPF